jgi:hypothetical protein
MKSNSIKYFVLGLFSILLVSYTTTNIQLFKPAKPTSVVVDCFSGKGLEETKLKIKSTSNNRSVDNFILKDMEITESGFYYSVCLYFERY